MATTRSTPSSAASRIVSEGRHRAHARSRDSMQRIARTFSAARRKPRAAIALIQLRRLGASERRSRRGDSGAQASSRRSRLDFVDLGHVEPEPLRSLVKRSVDLEHSA